jgi:hypothetical protein
MGVTSWYFSDVFKRLTAGEKNAAIREHWLRIREHGRPRFIRRQMFVSLLFWLILTLSSVSLQKRSTYIYAVVGNLVTLPIFLLGGYLEGRWKWTDFEKKYPEDGLPPWE